MGYVQARRLTPADVMWLCDNCQQEGLRDSGYQITDAYGEGVMWVCYNCKHKLYKGKFND